MPLGKLLSVLRRRVARNGRPKAGPPGTSSWRPPAFTLLLTAACATVPPGQGAVVLGPSGVHPEALGEGVSPMPWFGEVSLYDLRQQQVTVRFNALTQDGGLVTASASVVTFRIVPEELVALAREVGPGYAQTLVRPEAEAAVRLVVGGMQADMLDTEHIRLAQADVTRRAAARLRPYHLLLESVDLRTLQVLAPLAQAEVGHALVLQQEFLAAARQLEIARKRAEARREEAAGLADEFEAVARSLSPQTLEDLRLRAWTRLLQSPSSSVQVEAAGVPAIVEVSP
jgi:regulator of protease activity HflC (stomatin/prohibitin superfamily)